VASLANENHTVVRFERDFNINTLVYIHVAPSLVIVNTRSYYRKENAASPPRDGTMRNLLNKGLFIRSHFARTRYEIMRQDDFDVLK
jgi:hypothetical protein